ncbi:hypothetical protein EDC01DRAFT_631585 [Geopyxis carbonaria]|nr:hypothetical protein EDC01DRAFT_631585 [Geopyxis carbonaria]
MLVVPIYLVLRLAQAAIALAVFSIAAYLRWGSWADTSYYDDSYFEFTYTGSYLSTLDRAVLRPKISIAISVALGVSAIVATSALTALLTLRCARSRALFKFFIWWELFCAILLWGASAGTLGAALSQGPPLIKVCFALALASVAVGVALAFMSRKMMAQEKWSQGKAEVMVVVAPGVVVPYSQQATWVPPPASTGERAPSEHGEYAHGEYYNIPPNRTGTSVPVTPAPVAVEAPAGRM